MCDLCDSDEIARLNARGVVRRKADELKSIAKYFDLLADGDSKPHGEEAKNRMIQIRNMIRYLVAEWL